jgi:ClpP class serine protease
MIEEKTEQEVGTFSRLFEESDPAGRCALANEKIWACEPAYLLSYFESVQSLPKVSGQDTKAFFGIGGPPKEESILTVDGPIAILKIEGVLTRNGPGFWERLFGLQGTGYSQIIKAIDAVERNENIETLRLEINSPGGEVQGVDEIFQRLFALRKKKDVVAINNGLVASAAYWLASASEEIVSISPTAESGSIGVIITAVDYSERDRQSGVQRVRIVSRNAPEKNPDVTTQKGKDSLQKRADSIERVFIDRVAKGRNVRPDKVKYDFGNGGLLVSLDPDKSEKDALRAGMIDRVITSVDYAEDETRSTMGASETQEKESAMENEMKGKVEALEAQLKEVTAERDNLKSKLTAAIPLIESEEYPKAIRGLVCQVLKGEEDPGTLRGAVVAYDALKQSETQTAAVQDSEESSEAAGTVDEKPAVDGSIKSEQDYQEQVKRTRAMMGRV